MNLIMMWIFKLLGALEKFFNYFKKLITPPMPRFKSEEEAEYIKSEQARLERMKKQNVVLYFLAKNEFVFIVLGIAGYLFEPLVRLWNPQVASLVRLPAGFSIGILYFYYMDAKFYKKAVHIITKWQDTFIAELDRLAQEYKEEELKNPKKGSDVVN